MGFHEALATKERNLDNIRGGVVDSRDPDNLSPVALNSNKLENGNIDIGALLGGQNNKNASKTHIVRQVSQQCWSVL